MAKVKINSGSGTRVTINKPGFPRIPIDTSAPVGIAVKTGLGIATNGYPLYIRSVNNNAEIGVANNLSELITILNGNVGWQAYGTWSNVAGTLQCSGTPPAHVIGYNKVGVIYNEMTLADWSLPADGTTVTMESGGFRIITPDNAAHRLTLTGYGKTMMSALEVSFDIRYTSGGVGWILGIDGYRTLEGQTSLLQDNSTVDNTPDGSFVQATGVTYNVKLTMIDNYVKYVITDGANVRTLELFAGMSVTEHVAGYLYISLALANCLITNFKINCTAYKNADYLNVGDSVAWGRTATNWASTWHQSYVEGRPIVLHAHGDTGFDDWILSAHEIAAVDPVRVFVMGSYVNTPEGLSSFQTKYTNFINLLKANPTLQRIYHLATYPNNFSEDIRPFNNWKAGVFNTGIDQYINNYYAGMLEGISGYDLRNDYDGGGSHLNQTGQNYKVAQLQAAITDPL